MITMSNGKQINPLCVPCPHCNAKEGTECRSPSGRIFRGRWEGHRSRLRKAKIAHNMVDTLRDLSEPNTGDMS